MKSDVKTLTLTLAMSNDDDDDFQNPSEAVAVSQNLILSSLKNPNSSRTPKPSNGAPPRKRQKALVASGKENRRVSQAQTSRNLRVSRVREVKKAERDERRSLSSSIGAGPVEVCQFSKKIGVLGEHCNWNTNGSNLVKNRKVGEAYDEKSGVSYVYQGRKAVEEEMSGLSASDGGISKVNEGDGVKGEKSCNLTPNGSNLVEYSNTGEVSLEISTVPSTIDADEAVREERKNLLATIGSGCLELPLIYASSHHTSYDHDETQSIAIACTVGDELEEENSCLLTAVESQVVENSQMEEFVSEASTRFQNTAIRKEEKSCLLVSTDSKLVESGIGVSKGCKDTMGPKEEKRSYYSMSIESRLLGLKAKPGLSNVGNDCEDFDPGTQLNVLIDLCCEGGSSSSRVLSPEENDMGFESLELLMDENVECPLCGTNITGLSEELRQVHTNDCLDKDGTPEVATAVGEIKSDHPQKIVDVNPVLEWLHALGLSRYGEAFTREEVDWETLQSLSEEDLISIGVVTLGPRKKIIHALNDLRQNSLHGREAENDISNMTTSNTKLFTPGNKLITEFFQAPVGHSSVSSISKPLEGSKRTTKNSTCRTAGPRSHFSRGKVRDIPPWCCIPGTPFRVDAFRFLRGDCSHWFLTHFHMDHYQGLTRNFCHGKIYCSSITAHLVNTKIGVPWERLHILPFNQLITIAGVNLTCLDANHCPGSIIILFQPPNGKAVLHTGDFRFSGEMASSSVLQTCHVDTLILDTTYCNPQYDFPKQESVIQFVIEAIQAEAFNPKTLFLIGSYTIGKERLFLEVARLLRRKVYVGAAKLQLLRCLGLPEEDMQWFTMNEMESQIHVVPMWTIASFKRMKHISNQYSDRFNLIVAFSPTGWSFGKGKKKTPGRRWQQGTIIRYEVPYSEHCSFTELREFVQFVSPQHIIPSVNNDSPESADAMIALLMSVP